MHHQTIHQYPAAASGNEQDIIAAAESRAKFWGYKGHWTVPVRLGKRVVQVTKNTSGEVQIKR